MVRVRSLFLLAAAIAVAASLGGPLVPARADNLTVDVYLMEGSTTTFHTSFTSTNGNATQFFAGNTITDGTTSFSNLLISATSNQPGNTAGNLNQVNVGSSGSTGSGTLVVKVTEGSPFLFPGVSGGHMNLTSGVSRSDGQTQTLQFQSWATDINGNVVTWGQQTYDSSVSSASSPNSVATQFTRGDSYSMTNEMWLQAGSSNITVTGSTQVTMVPEPGSMLLLLSGAPVGLGFWLRRRRNSASSR